MTASPDGQRMAYGASRAAGGVSVVVDGKEGPVYQRVPGHNIGMTSPEAPTITFSPDGEHVAYVACKGNGKWVMVVDQQEGAEYNGIVGEGPSYSSDSRHTVYAASKAGRYLVVVDRDEHPATGQVTGVGFARQSLQPLYIVDQNPGKMVVLADRHSGFFDGYVASAAVEGLTWAGGEESKVTRWFVRRRGSVWELKLVPVRG